MVDENKINSIGDVSGSNIRIAQIYAPGAAPLKPEIFVRYEAALPFSVAWLTFPQGSIPFVGRETDLVRLHEFLSEPSSFSWWSIVGEGGIGKSRLALEFSGSLPEGWSGGFLPRENTNVRDIGGWDPAGHTLWIIDDAAALGSKVGQIIGTLASLHFNSQHKVRLLLLDRAYSPEAGWWAELIDSFEHWGAAVRQTLFERPLALSPPQTSVDAFFAAASGSLDEAISSRVHQGLQQMSEQQVLEQSQGGNPLLLQLIFAELAVANGAPGPTDRREPGTVIDRYLARELDRLKGLCKASRIRFRAMLDLLFLTTSCYPIPLLQDEDLVVARYRDGVFMKKGLSGLWELPTNADLRAIGLDLQRDNRAVLDSLREATGVEDLEVYLSVLRDAGLASTRFAIRPDVLSSALIGVLINAPDASLSLRRRRGEFDPKRATRLVAYAFAISLENASGAWARLSGEAILTLVRHARSAGRSIRWTLLLLRNINERRETKTLFHPEVVFAPNRVHPDAPAVGRYFAEVRSAITRSDLDIELIGHLARSRHSWVLPYIEILVELSTAEAGRLGLIICSVTNHTVLNRLTNLSLFLISTYRIIGSAFPPDAPPALTPAEKQIMAALIQRHLHFVQETAWPILSATGEKDFKDPHLALARGVIASSFAVINELIGRDRSVDLSEQVLRTLLIARQALETAHSPEDLAYLERNEALLQVAAATAASDVAAIYANTLQRLADGGTPESMTDAFYDLFYFCASRGDPAIFANAALLLTQCSKIVAGEPILPVVLESIKKVGPRGRSHEFADVIFSLCDFFIEKLQQTQEGGAAETLPDLFDFAAQIASGLERPSEIVDRMNRLRAMLDQGQCSPLFLEAALGIAQRAQYLLRERWPKSKDQIPFDTVFVEVSEDELLAFAADEGDLARFSGWRMLVLGRTRYSTSQETRHEYRCTYLDVADEASGGIIRAGDLVDGVVQRILDRSAAAAVLRSSGDDSFD